MKMPRIILNVRDARGDKYAWHDRMNRSYWYTCEVQATTRIMKMSGIHSAIRSKNVSAIRKTTYITSSAITW